MTVPKLEALVGHLFIVGGKTIHNAPPGTRVELPPRRVHRSREDDTLFVLITGAGRKQMPADLFDELAKLGAETYFRSKGGVTGALRDSVMAINAKLYNGEYRAGAVLLAKRKEDVYVARCGSTLIAVRGQEGYSTFPSDPELLNMFPLGSQTEPMLEFTRYPLGVDDIFVLGDAGFATVTDKVLEACIAKGNVEQILDQLETVVTKQATATVIQFVLPEGEGMPIVAEKPKPVDVPTRAPATNPAPVPVASSALTPSPSPNIVGRGETASGSAPAVAAKPVPVAMLSPEALKNSAGLDVALDEPAPAQIETEVGATTSELSETGFLSYSTPAEISATETPVEVTLTDAEVAIETPAEVEAEPLAELQAEAMPTRRQRNVPPKTITEKPKPAPRPNPLAKVLRASGRGLSTGINRFLPDNDDSVKEREAIPFNVMLMIAIFIPAIIAVVVVGFVILDKGSTSTVFERQRQYAIDAFAEAQEYSAQPNADRKTARDLWAIAKGHASDALRNNVDDDQIVEIFKTAQQQLDFYDRVRRVEVTELHTFGPNADLRGPIIGNGVDMYVMDHNRSTVYHMTMNSAGDKILEQEDQPVIERGMAIRTDIVSNLVDLVWMDDGGAAQDNAIVALDENGMLISYSPVYPPADGLKLNLPPAWQRPIAIAMWRSNFYVLDAGANQIWRFVPVDGYYKAAPEEYFAGQTRPELGEAVDFNIDSDGSVYILFGDGHIEKYLGGEPENFSIFEGPVDEITETTALYLNPDPISYALYLGAAGNEAVYQVSLGGRINDGYRPANPPLNAFKDVTGVYALGKNVYVLAGNKLYYLVGS